MPKKLATSNLCYAHNKQSILTDISLEFHEGKLHGILGPNGSGKSTFLKLLSGIWKPTSGTILWNNEPLLSQDRQTISRIISLVPQQPQTYFDFLVEDIVAMGRYAYNRSYWQTTQDPKVQEALKIVDAWHLRDRCVNQLSFGERQRVYIARALVTESPILLLDEPTASLDIQHHLEIWALLQQLVEKGKIVIVTTHDLAIAERYCQHVAILNQGKCTDNGKFTDLMRPALLKEVFGVAELPQPHLRQYTSQF